ncbi:MAG: hypothetical protein U0P45_13445 [Acidimicrobiales bacterium]
MRGMRGRVAAVGVLVVLGLVASGCSSGKDDGGATKDGNGKGSSSAAAGAAAPS